MITIKKNQIVFFDINDKNHRENGPACISKELLEWCEHGVFIKLALGYVGF